MNDNLQKLYDVISQDVEIKGGFDVFSQKMSSPKDRLRFYNDFKDDYDLGSYDDFEDRLKKRRFFRRFGTAIRRACAYL